MLSDRILYIDESLLVIDKPAGLRTLPDGYDRTLPYIRGLLEPDYGRLWIVHRLDRETSGVLVLARNPAAHHALNDQFSAREVRKTYHALVSGLPGWDEMTADGALRKNGDRQHRTVIDPLRGKPADTHLRVLERFLNTALIVAEPHSGYTHQIRAHLAALGYPLLSDPLYGGPPNTDIPRVALHALNIQFHHPVSRASLTFSTPYPLDFSTALDSLRRAIRPVV